MEINSINQLASVAQQATQTTASATDPSLASQFSQLMQLGGPEISQAANLATPPADSLVGTVTSAGVGHSPSPEAMLAGQLLMGKAIVEVDLAAKTAGALSQSVNKLVNMQ
jgi:type III secretion system YscI/HrpB-like protein